MNLRPTAHRPAGAGALTLVTLESLPCGCVSGVYQANAVMALELVEAKGPHCVFTEHRAGGIVRLGLFESTP